MKAIIWLIMNGISIYTWTSLAYMERGYAAVGGEFFMIILTAIATGMLLKGGLKRARVKRTRAIHN